MAAGLSFFGFVMVRYRSRLLTGLASRWVAWRGLSASTRERVLIIGGGESGQFAAWMMSHGQYRDSFQVTGFVDDDLYKQDKRIAGLTVIGQRTDIAQLVKKYDIGIIVFAIHNISAEEKQVVLKICSSTPARVFLFPNLQEALNMISRNGNGNSHHADSGEDFSQLYTQGKAAITGGYDHLFAAGGFLLGMEEWLAELEGSARSGDVESVLNHIQEMRNQMHMASARPAETQTGYQE
jgi:hypothetical protein